MLGVLTTHTHTKPNKKQKTNKQQHTQRERRKLWEELAMSLSFIMVVVSQMFASIHTHQIVTLNICSSLCIDYISIKLLIFFFKPLFWTFGKQQ